ncbi:MAG: C2 family cysteine protease [Saprospiraceae bacterium]|nr:C2 family cysteine protease [Saprospiraceae bacterium]
MTDIDVDDFCAVAPDDVQQEINGNCTLIAALMQIAAKEPALIKNAIKPQSKTKNKAQQEITNYAVTLYLPQEDKPSKRVTVIISNEFYAINPGQPFFAGKGDKELWVLLIEKAVASLLGGYAIFEEDGHAINKMLTILTGQEAARAELGKSMELEELKKWLEANKNKVLTIANAKHAYSITAIDLDEDVITVLEPIALKTSRYTVMQLHSEFVHIASCDLTADTDCPSDWESKKKTPVQTTNSFLKMTKLDQLELFGNQNIQWKTYENKIGTVLKIDSNFVVMEIDGQTKEVYTSELEFWQLQPVIPISKVVSTVKEIGPTVKWIDKEGTEYAFMSIYNGLIELESPLEMLELSSEEFCKKFGILNQ